MTTLAFDGKTGASGDILLAALVAAGADPQVLEPVVEALPVRYRIGSTVEDGISAVTVDVLLADPDADDEPAVVDEREEGRGAMGGHGHGHEHGDGHVHVGHKHSHAHERGDENEPSPGHETVDEGHHAHDAPRRAEGAGPTRTYPEVVELVEGMTLPPDVRDDALAVFELLGRAESSVHGTALDEAHFHEVGADDAIADVVGVCLLLDDLGVEQVLTTPVAVGGGEVETSHGTYPVPSPAVTAIAERADWELRGGPVERELLTPTGAALLAHFADGVEVLPPLRVRKTGYGAGGYDLGGRPNVLRAMVADGGSSGALTRQEITVLETNLDDVSPEILGGLQETLQDAGALDVTVVPTTMKKSRPGHLVKVIVHPSDAARVAHRLAVETGTLGVREHGAGHRWIADRTVETVSLEIDGETFEVGVKVASDEDGATFDVSAEYDDAVAVASATGLAIREVLRRAENATRT